VRAACERVGLSREAAYWLRRRDDEFARGWAAALVLAHDAGEELLAACATEGIEEQIWYRGELVGTRRRIDARLLLAHLPRLDAAASMESAQRDAGRFDELLAVIAGEQPPEDLLAGDDVLPVEREAAAIRAHRGGRREALARWDGWRAGACSVVDAVLAREGAEFSPRTVSDVSTAALAAGLVTPPPDDRAARGPD